MYCPQCDQEPAQGPGICPDCFGDLMEERPSALEPLPVPSPRPAPEAELEPELPPAPSRAPLVAAGLALCLALSLLGLRPSPAPDSPEPLPEPRPIALVTPEPPDLSEKEFQAERERREEERRARLEAARGNLEKARALLAQGQTREAESIAREGLGLLIRHRAGPAEVAEAHALLAAIFDHRGDPGQADYHHAEAAARNRDYAGRPAVEPDPPSPVEVPLPTHEYPTHAPQPAEVAESMPVIVPDLESEPVFEIPSLPRVEIEMGPPPPPRRAEAPSRVEAMRRSESRLGKNRGVLEKRREESLLGR